MFLLHDTIPMPLYLIETMHQDFPEFGCPPGMTKQQVIEAGLYANVTGSYLVSHRQ